MLQGLGGGGLMTLSQAIIGELVPPVERVRFQGYFALVFTTASIGGPIVGGIVVSHVSWRWLFFANLPFAIFAAWRLSRLPAGERHPPPAGPPDVTGHVLFAIAALSTALLAHLGGPPVRMGIGREPAAWRSRRRCRWRRCTCTSGATARLSFPST